MHTKPTVGHGINRQVEISSRSTDRPLAFTHLKYISGEQLKLLTPLDANGEVIQYAPHEVIVLRELPRGVPPISHETYVIEAGVPNSIWGSLLILAQPQDHPVRKRQFARVETVFPVSVDLINSQESVNGLVTNLGAGGVLFTVTEGNPDVLNPGLEISIELNLPDGEMFVFPGVIRRSYRIERDSRNFHVVAVEFQVDDGEQQEALVRYVLTREIELRTLDLVKEEVPLDRQLEMLREEIVQLREELKLAHEREAQAAEARRRSDAIIMQLTQQLDEQTRRAAELQRRHRVQWWKFWMR